MTADPMAGAETDAALLLLVVAAARAAGARLVQRFGTPVPLDTPAQVLAAVRANDAAAEQVLRPLLEAARPSAAWAEDEEAGGALPAGEWWVVDPAEGNINHLHGLPADWAVSVTLVRDNTPVLTVVHLPLAPSADRASVGTTYTALAGRGAWRDGDHLHTSSTRLVSTALVGTGQARPGEDSATLTRIGASVTAVLHAALLVRMQVPATLPLLDVAAGRADGFWQYSDVRSGLVAGALLVTEAGGVVTDTGGRPWTTGSSDFLATAPGIHRETVDVLAAAA